MNLFHHPIELSFAVDIASSFWCLVSLISMTVLFRQNFLEIYQTFAKTNDKSSIEVCATQNCYILPSRQNLKQFSFAMRSWWKYRISSLKSCCQVENHLNELCCKRVWDQLGLIKYIFWASARTCKRNFFFYDINWNLPFFTPCWNSSQHSHRPTLSSTQLFNFIIPTLTFYLHSLRVAAQVFV